MRLHTTIDALYTVFQDYAIAHYCSIDAWYTVFQEYARMYEGMTAPPEGMDRVT